MMLGSNKKKSPLIFINIFNLLIRSLLGGTEERNNNKVDSGILLLLQIINLSKLNGKFTTKDWIVSLVEFFVKRKYKLFNEVQ